MSKKILVIASDFPYPPNHGGRVDIFERLKVLKELKFEIYLISTVKISPSNDELIYMDKLLVRSFILHRKQSFVALFSLKPYQVTSRNNIDDIDIILNSVKDIKFNACIIEGHYCLEIYDKISNNCTINQSFLRVHNDETKYFCELAKSTKNILKKIFYYVESLKFTFLEKYFFKKNIISACLHISSDELIKYKNKYSFLEHIFLPASVDIKEFVTYKKNNDKTVLFIGSLFMSNNIEGLMWYLRNVHNKLCRLHSDYKLIIAGNTKGIRINSFIETINKFKYIDFYDSPDNLDYLYEQSMIFINPMLSGAGVKLKTINAVKYGLPIVSTKIGNEGTGLINKQDILVAEDEQSFFDNIILLLSDEVEREKIVNNSQLYIKNTYNQIENLKGILLASKELGNERKEWE